MSSVSSASTVTPVKSQFPDTNDLFVSPPGRYHQSNEGFRPTPLTPQSFRDLRYSVKTACWLFTDLKWTRWISGRPLKAAGTSSEHTLKAKCTCTHTFRPALEHFWWILDGVMGRLSEEELCEGMEEARGKMESDGGSLFVFCPQVLKLIQFNWIQLPAVQIRFRLTGLRLDSSISWLTQTDRDWGVNTQVKKWKCNVFNQNQISWLLEINTKILPNAGVIW